MGRWNAILAHKPAASLSSCLPSCFLRDHQLMSKGTSSCHLLCVFFVTGTILGPFSVEPYFLLRKSSASPTSISPSKERHRMDMSGPSMLGCRLRMTREEIKVKATYHSLYGFFSPLNVPLSMQTKRDFTIERSLEQLDSERQARWKEASRSVKVQAPARAGTNTTRGLEGRGVTVDAECSREWRLGRRRSSREHAWSGTWPWLEPGRSGEGAKAGSSDPALLHPAVSSLSFPSQIQELQEVREAACREGLLGKRALLGRIDNGRGAKNWGGSKWKLNAQDNTHGVGIPAYFTPALSWAHTPYSLPLKRTPQRPCFIDRSLCYEGKAPFLNCLPFMLVNTLPTSTGS